MIALKFYLPQFRARVRNFALPALLAASVLLGGCASLIAPQSVSLREQRPADLPARAELSKVPFFPQTEYQCGPAALATVLANAKVKVKPDDLVSQVYIPERKGSLQVEMLAAARRHGMISYQLAPRYEDVLREIAAGTPVIVLQDFGVGPFDMWHYAVAVGYDLDEDNLVLRSGEKQRQVLKTGLHEFVWKRSGYWAMVVVPPTRIPATAQEGPWLSAIAAYERVGNPRTARVAYTTFLKRWPENVSASVGLANTYYAAGDLKESEKVLRTALAREPDSVVVLNNLAQTLSDQGRNLEALAYINRAAAGGGPFAGAVGETRTLILKRIKH
jgi:tetratricopeptide (TPR) repeat protein